MTTKSNLNSEGYRIGAVSRLTGLSADILRVWERRYEAVTPDRKPNGSRFYTLQDVTRLKMMKQLVDAGDNISSIATLGVSELEDRVSIAEEPISPISDKPARVVLIGETLILKLTSSDDQSKNIEIMNTFMNETAFLSQADKIDADILIFDQPTLHSDTAIKINDWINRIDARKAIIIYRFAAKDVLDKLKSDRCITLRAPVDTATIEQYCTDHHTTSVRYDEPIEETDPSHDVIPPRRYNDETLIKIASAATAVKCECPKHLTELISGLSAFEIYSSECENRNDIDAALHHYLYQSAARARHIIEDALSKVIEVDNIKY